MNKALFTYILFLLFVNYLGAKDCIPGRIFELVINGDFEQGNNYFETDYQYSLNGRNEKTYSVINNPNLSYTKFDSCKDHTSGTGKMMVINGDTTSTSVVWKQLIKKIKKFTTYDLSFWYTPINNLPPPILYAKINEETLQPYPIFMKDSACNWQKAAFLWNSGSSDSAELKILDLAKHVAGNDFAIDDISFMEHCRIQACAGNDLYVCKLIPVQLNGLAKDGYGPYTYNWFPSAGLDNSNIQNPIATINQTTTYYFTAIDTKGCSATDTITVYAYDLPDNAIKSNKSLPVCPCDSVLLTAAAGYNYLWSTGEQTQQITVSKPGNYNVELTDKNGCMSFGSIQLTKLNVSADFGIDSFSIKGGSNVDLKIKMNNQQNLIDCGYSSYRASISYNPSVLLPAISSGKIDSGFPETITFNSSIYDSLNNILHFTALLGNSECTDVIIDKLEFACDSVQLTLNPGKVCISDVCKEGGPRLIDMSDSVFFKYHSMDNNISLKYSVIEESETIIKIYDYSGRLTDVLIDEYLTKGQYTTYFNSDNLQHGLNFIVYTSGNYRRIIPFIR